MTRPTSDLSPDEWVDLFAAMALATADDDAAYCLGAPEDD